MKYILLVLFSGILLGCASNLHTTKLYPIGKVDSWNQGIPVLKVKGNNHDVSASYVGGRSDGYIFNISVYRKAAGDIDLDLSNTLCKSFSFPIVRIDLELPEKELHERKKPGNDTEEKQYTDMALSHKKILNPDELIAKNRRKLDYLANPPLLFVLEEERLAWKDLLTVPKDEQHRKELEQRIREREQEYEREKARIARLKQKISYLEQGLFRNQTLSEGHTTSGLVVCPRSTASGKELVLYFKIEQEDFPFKWEIKQNADD